MSVRADMDWHRFICLLLLTSQRFCAGQISGCSQGQWQCGDGSCIPDLWRCDGSGDCLDGSDEMDCAALPGSPKCPPGQFPCLDSVGCVDVSARCDGQSQCPTGSDEENCTATKGCLDSDWSCRNYICIPKELRCSGLNDCMDNSDEEGCGVCDEDHIRCPEGVCVSAEKRCDGQAHCSDGSDEPITCGHTCSVNNGGCSHMCVDEPWGALCACPVGYKLSPNGAVCEDVDECAASFSPCQHHCSNTIGSYYCHCREGFKLNGSATCLATGNATRLLMVQGGAIGLLDVKSQQFEVVQTPTFDPVALTFDIARGWYFWADSHGSIHKSDGQYDRTIFTGEPGIKGLACDWLNGNLYWTNQKTESIYMQAAGGSSCTTVLSKNISPSDVVLVPVESLMFWINVGQGDRVTIEKSWMDGKGRSSLVVLTAQSAHSLTTDMSTRRLFWISDFKKSVETVKLDGTGRYSFTGLFNQIPGLSLAVFESSFYWADNKGLWQASQSQPHQKTFLGKAKLPLLTVYHELQQPEGFSACVESPCHLCQLTKGNPVGFTCACPNFKALLLDGTCEYPKFIYATFTSINLLEFRIRESTNTQLLSIDDGILSFDLDWFRSRLYWTNQTGHVVFTGLTQVKTEMVPTPLPVCLIKVDQSSGSLYWVSCDQNSIGTTTADGYSQQLYRTAKEIGDLYLDWLRGGIYWIEEEHILTMSMVGDKARELLQLAGGVRGNIAFDLRANSLLWNSKRAGLTTLSLLQERSYQAGRRWNISGSVVAAFEPFLLSLSEDNMTLWDRRDGSPIQQMTVTGPVMSAIAALMEIHTVLKTPLCNETSVLCRRSAACLSQALLCDGNKDCPDGEDEEFCVTCPSIEDFKCKDHRSCISRNLVCDGHAHCQDGSDEVDCSLVASPAIRLNILRCRRGFELCADGTECILSSHVCDGEQDCQDGSDELECDVIEHGAFPASKSPSTTHPPPTVPTCHSPSVLCPSVHLCISPNQFCNGFIDCPGGFDEKNCVKRCPSNNDFLCKDRRGCISKSLVCDGRAHCLDGSDEVNCPSVSITTSQPNALKCRIGSKLCSDGRECVLHSHICDGEADCVDGSDEQGCPEACSQGEFQCSHGKMCIPEAQVCDGKPQCQDKSDELDCWIQTKSCEHRCADNKRCIPKKFLCDGERDCLDGTDEVGCDSIPAATELLALTSTSACITPSVLCPGSSLCLSQNQLCDGIRDCPDGSDENDCVLQCNNPGDFLCSDRRKCIPWLKVCDGHANCPDGSDEKRCGSAHPIVPSSIDVLDAKSSPLRCRRGFELCADGRECVLSSHVCDGERDCRDGSDELGCDVTEQGVVSSTNQKSATDSPTLLTCRSPAVLCPSAELCISPNQFCNGLVDCPDGFDEKNCVKRCSSNNDFLCKDRRSCVSKSLVCDGRAHCHDGSDEVDCPSVSNPATTKPLALTTSTICIAPSVLCPGSSLCLSQNQLCDGIRDCPDGSDENDCVLQCNNPDDFLCSDRRKCIPWLKVCDGHANCPDGSDEKRCGSAHPTVPSSIDVLDAKSSPLRCRRGFELCADGSECVLSSHVCDGERDCQDGSDELGCDVTEQGVVSPTNQKSATDSPTLLTCRSPAVLCPSAELCISPNQFCNGLVDCPDGFDEKNCVKRCSSNNDFLCKDRRSCVSKSLVCDGRAHCHDGSDEFDCPSVSNPATTKPLVLTTSTICITPSVLCPGSSLCLSQNQLCDGIRDCPDGFDENDCVLQCNNPGDFLCRDRRKCIPRIHVCDGHANCPDGSDEKLCGSAHPTFPSSNDVLDAKSPLRCRRGFELCADGRECVLSSHVCDGERDCQDGSDELGCDGTKWEVSPTRPIVTAHPPPTVPTCHSPSVLCPSVHLCISPNQFCNGFIDCPGGFDEKNCVKRCPSNNDFLCKDRRGCISKSLVCDGRAHCLDGSDEVNCPSVSITTSQPNALKCRIGSKLCNDGRECVLHSHICDGEADCVDGSDEQGCPEACSQGEFQCSHGKMCIPEAQVCDGKPQCQDKSDELDCWIQTKSCEHRCADNKRCIPKKFLCDGERDCLDGTDEVGCDSIPAATTKPLALTTSTTCITPSVLCPGSSLCLSQNQLCDGIRDCPDGSDENDCVLQCNNPGDFLCRDRRKCIPRIKVCDGHANCPDGSDEKQCGSAHPTVPSSISVLNAKSSPVTCRRGFRPCNDGLECVIYSHWCDGEMDCLDGSDEEGCVSHCKAGEFQCVHGSRCIPPDQMCDGQYDCRDQSDEMDCSRLGEGCDQRCDNNTRCIPETFLCDGERDCADGSDEEKCDLVPCAFHQYRCISGQCVSEALRCDGYADCSDRSDEMHCTRPPRCPTQLRCPNSHECLQQEWLCDGEDDCPDGSDEKNCMTPVAKCREYQWQCGDSSQCIPASWRCDGKEDCHNGVDEDKCRQRKCPTHLYQCDSGECVDPQLVCNGFTNCADSSDEGVGCAQHNCSSPLAPRCDHHCVSTPNGANCYCTAGFRLQSSTMSCVDIDECSTMTYAVCKHICLNTRGSYMCRCHPGFYLEPDNKSCKTKDEPVLLASVQTELLLVGVHSGTLRLLSSASRPVFSLDYHWAQQRIYWLSPDYQSIRWVDVKDSNNKGTLIKGVKSDFIAVDWIGKNLYWVDGLVGQILVMKLSNTTLRSQDYTVVLDEDLEQPSSLVLLSHRGLMFWSEIGSRPQIERSGMDGSKRKMVVSRGLSWPVSLACDLLDNRIYWADEKLRCIGSASLDGDNVKILQLVETPSPFSVVVFNDRVFWSDTKRRTIRSADKNTGKDQKVLVKRPGQPFGLKLMHPLSQPAISNPCDKLHCSHLCLLAPAVRARSGALGTSGGSVGQELTAVCRCPKGLLLSEDKLTCSLPTESTSILLLSHTTVYQIYLRSMHEDGVALKKMPINRALALPGVTEATALDVSIQELYLYVADAGQGSVNVLKLGNPRSRQGLTPVGKILQLKDDSVTALAVDWVTSNLYWSSTQRPDLHVTSHHDGYTTLLLQGSLKGTTSIALHPPSGLLCYTAIVMAGGKSQTEVSCAWMDGRNKAVLWRKSSSPTSLALLNEGTVICWADTSEGVINSIGVDGSGYKQYKTGPGLLVSFTYIEKMFLWVTLDKDVTKLWFGDGLQPKQLWFETKTSVVEVKGWINDIPSGTNSCSNNNGGCPHLCLPYPQGRTCVCGRGFYKVNATSCVHLPACPAGKDSCFDGSKCISSSKFCDGHVDCLDQSDEQECSKTNLASFGTKASEGFPRQFSSTPHPKAEENSGLSIKKDSTPCDLQHCNGHGHCITENEVIHCHCVAGYKGEFCQETEHGESHVVAILGVLCLLAVLMGAAFIFAKSRAWELIRNRSGDKETLMGNMGLPEGHSDSDSEELESPADVTSTPLALTSL